ncbi:MAG: acetyl-CoA C-acyltransferase, partial [Nitrospinota bacterium]
APVELKDRKGNVTEFKQDEHPRPGTSLESLARLKPVFKADGVITAGNASGICDGASAMVLASAEKAEERGLKPIGRLISWAVCGVDPTVMGIGPVPSSKKALERAGLGLDDMDLFEINEAFAPQYLAVEKELGLDRSKVNVNGGAIAIGHPVGTSGNRLTLTILHELRRRGGRFGLAGACIGGGQGMSLVVEALS